MPLFVLGRINFSFVLFAVQKDVFRPSALDYARILPNQRKFFLRAHSRSTCRQSFYLHFRRTALSYLFLRNYKCFSRFYPRESFRQNPENLSALFACCFHFCACHYFFTGGGASFISFEYSWNLDSSRGFSYHRNRVFQQDRQRLVP